MTTATNATKNIAKWEKIASHHETDMKRRSDIHLSRKIWHALAVLFLALSYSYLPEEQAKIWLFVFTFLIAIPIDFLRLKIQGLNEFIVHLVKPLMRDTELRSWMGTSYLLAGVSIVALIFPKPIVLLSMLFLALADPVASYVGIRFGKDKIIGKKSLQGSIAAFVICTLIMFIFLAWESFPIDRLVILSLFGGIIGALAELIPVQKLDDNFTFPILSSTVLWLLFTAFDVFAMLPLF